MTRSIPKRDVRAASVFGLAVWGLLGATTDADAAKLKALYDFCPRSGCADGVNPYAPLSADAAGNLYGTTLSGGNSSEHGTIYELQKQKNGYKFKLRYQFCNTDCSDGEGSFAGLVADKKGNLYGTTTQGTARGVVFMLSPGNVYTVLHHFCTTDCMDGAYPAGGLTYENAVKGKVYDGSSPLYGVTENGGTHNEGVVYVVTPDGSETALYSFGSKSAGSINPNTTLTPDGKGNLYGAALAGGKFGHGAIFKTTTSGGETILHSFCAQTDCKDGGNPGGEGGASGGALLLDSQGDLYGTVPSGGKFGNGVLYRSSGKKFTVLYDFCKKANCADGAKPESGLVMDRNGTLYGVAPTGGDPASAAGVIFAFGKTFSDVYTFCTQQPCKDGGAPISALLLGPNRTLFGTTQQGGDFTLGPSGGGNVFNLRP